MAEFTQIIKSGKSQTAYLHRQALLTEINSNVTLIKELDRENPIVRPFIRFESNINDLLNDLKLANVELTTHLVKANAQIHNDESFITDKKLVNEQVFSACKAIDEYTQLLNSKGIQYPPDVKPVTSSGDLAAVLTTLDKNITTLVASQNKNVADLSKTLVNELKSYASCRSGPKAIQPKFRPKNSDSDYGEFDFLSKFEFFTAKCSNNLE